MSKLILSVIMLMLLGCSFSKAPDPVAKSLAQIQIGPDDWIVTSGELGEVSHVTKRVKPDKIEFLRKNFRMPRLTSITVPESSGFEIYEIQGYPELEFASYIHPKLYINSAMDRGSILGYRTGRKDLAGNDVIEISIPVALVNGLVPNIPLVGGPQSGAGAAVTLPGSYRIENPDALKQRLGKEIKTLPVCPKLFRLSFEGREYWTRSPFESLSNCPLNQFFRVKFEAPVESMKRLLDTAAIHEEAVTLLTDLSVPFEYPTKREDVSIEAPAFRRELVNALKSVPHSGETVTHAPSYAVQDIEATLVDILFAFGNKAGLGPKTGRELGSTLQELMSNYFSRPIPCQGPGTCRALLKNDLQKRPVQFGWLETESLGAALETQTITSLGSVANSSRFMARPARDELAQMRKPNYFKGREFAQIIRECQVLVASHFSTNPGATPSEKAFVESYCRTVAENAVRDSRDLNQLDGYYPLGNNTVVYPGAWLRIDIDQIAEFTTAKTRTNKDGSVSVESEVIDLLAGVAPEKRTSCINGGAVACREYKKTRIPIRDTDGSHRQEAIPCPKSEEGKDGCKCEKRPSGDEVCARKGQYLFQDVQEHTCEPQDEIVYCPYWRTEETVVDYEIEYACQDVKVDDQTSFLCLGGCSAKHELQCKEKGRKPVKALRQVLNCVEDENERLDYLTKLGAKELPPKRAGAHRVRECKRPKYKCAQWETSCTHYAVNEAFHINHEEIAPKWRPFAVDQGEFPARFEEDIYLKFVSKNNRVATNCRLSDFPRELRGSTIYVKLPSERNEERPCDKPIWDEDNIQPANLPKVYLRDAISYPERRLCGKTEYSFLTKEIPMLGGDGIIPPEFSFKTVTHIGPIEAACTAPMPFLVGRDLWFTEHPPIRFSGRVSVLGRMLESILTEAKH